MTTGVFGGTTPRRVALLALAGAAMMLMVAALAFSFDVMRLAAEATCVRASGGGRSSCTAGSGWRLEFA